MGVVVVVRGGVSCQVIVVLVVGRCGLLRVYVFVYSMHARIHLGLVLRIYYLQTEHHMEMKLTSIDTSCRVEIFTVVNSSRLKEIAKIKSR